MMSEDGTQRYVGTLTGPLLAGSSTTRFRDKEDREGLDHRRECLVETDNVTQRCIFFLPRMYSISLAYA